MNLEGKRNIVIALRILYPIWMLIGIFSMIYVPSTLIDYEDIPKTLDNITNQQFLFRLGIFGRLVTQLFFILIPLLLYQLFKDFQAFASLLMLGLALSSVPITMYSEVSQLNMLEVLSELDTAMALLDTYWNALDISILFWGLWLFPLGWLVYQCNGFPKVIGIALYVGGVGYLLDAVIDLLFPDFKRLNQLLEILTIGETIFILWLVIMGIRKEKNVESSIEIVEESLIAMEENA
ncbi:MAG: DUF4386 domain-containing protein [Bacteroidota bacterium]